jgi:hypothetical protein
VRRQPYGNRRTTFHVLLERSTTTGLAYSHNRLRNMLLHYSRYDYFVALDVDFIPTRNIYKGLLEMIRQPPALLAPPPPGIDNKTDSDSDSDSDNIMNDVVQMLHRHTVFVLPSFHMDPLENHTFATPDMLPQNRDELLQMYKNGTVQDYTKRKLSHGATGYYHYTKVKEPYYKIHPNRYFEPYVLGYRRGIPNYWEDFRGFGFNKQSWCWELIMAGYQYSVLRDFYLVHLNHPLSKRQQHSRHKNKPIWYEFNHYLKDRYNTTGTEG